STNLMSRSVSSPFSFRAPSITTSVPARVRRLIATAPASAVSRGTECRAPDDDVLHPLPLLDFAPLRFDVAAAKSAIDDPEAAFLRLHGGHRRSRDGVHIRRDEGTLERDVGRETAGKIDHRWIAPLDHAELRAQQKIVERRAANRVHQRVDVGGHAGYFTAIVVPTDAARPAVCGRADTVRPAPLGPPLHSSTARRWHAARDAAALGLEARGAGVCRTESTLDRETVREARDRTKTT